jgi:excisionase family DNA binding protein
MSSGRVYGHSETIRRLAVEMRCLSPEVPAPRCTKTDVLVHRSKKKLKGPLFKFLHVVPNLLVHNHLPFGTRSRPRAGLFLERLLTLREAAEVLRLSPRTVREYVQRGEIEGRIIGGRWRFRRAALDAFFENAPRNWDFAGNHDHGK